jgi:hypothetical protein|nr:MAG TPA: hypothetical protein [Caudoviricetes sp.]
MKITNERNYKQPNGQIDYMSLINDLQDEYGTIYWNTLDGEIFIYRPLGRLEYRQLINADITDIEKEDTVCKACLLHPTDFDFDNCPAGIPKQLHDLILKNSFLDSLESKKLIVAYHRSEMAEFDNQITCIINEAFPNIDIEEIESWDMAKTAKYLSRAEWKLNVLRQIPIDYDTSNKMMENEWVMQHSKGNEEMNEEDNVKTENNTKPQPQHEFKVETLEERQARMKKEGPRRKTPEELAELKRRFPEIKWDYEVDPNVNIDDMSDSMDVRAVALRPGF